MNINGGGSCCVMWEVDLIDMRRYVGSQDGGQDIYVRAAISDLAPPPVAESTKNGSANSNQIGKVVGITMSTCAMLIFILILIYLKRKQTRTLITSMDREGPQGRTEESLVDDDAILPNRRRDNHGKTTMDELELPLFNFTTVAIATNNFSKTNELGRGGFGPVTSGYMSPEYMMNGNFSRKSDVFNFGVLILEIGSGKRNRGSSNTDSQLNLLAQAWKLWNEERALELLDESIGTKFSENEVLRCIQIGLLCVQELPKDRPKMSEVMLLLSSETMGMSPLKHPGFFFRNENLEPEISSKKDDSVTVNQITLTVIEPR
ncbi:unnamed protein product [Lactuca saligna]|uniref:Protein kinase domain-containing protein n=1 Tax=Lactuca saligna TaxID=75948 RepID=A0AA36EEI1_LACSI|nr:unnamed protein product [Lactuca saligna]